MSAPPLCADRPASHNRRVSGGLPHSEIPGSKGALASPGLIAECHVLHRLLLPRHPPNALLALDPIQKQTGPKPAPLVGSRLDPTRPMIAHGGASAAAFRPPSRSVSSDLERLLSSPGSRKIPPGPRPTRRTPDSVSCFALFTMSIASSCDQTAEHIARMRSAVGSVF